MLLPIQIALEKRFRVQFNVEFPLQVMNFPIAYKEDKDTFSYANREEYA